MNSDKTGFVQKTMDIKGMTCKSCVKLIESGVGDLKGVKDIKVDLAHNKASVKFNPKETSLKKIQTKISSLGYSAGGMKAAKGNKGGFFSGLLYGLAPHTGCILFIVASILGSTLAMEFFKPLLMNRNIFYGMIGLSFLFATVSSAIYLKKNDLLSLAGVKRKWGYLSVMYGSTIGINLLLFMFVFPMLANIGSIPSAVALAADSDLSLIKLQVAIPCSGHAPLISEELKKINGVEGVRFSLPSNFDVTYDSKVTSKAEILSLEVFNTYKATVLEESASQTDIAQVSGQQSQTAGGCCGGGGSCGGSGGGCGCGGGLK